MNKEKLEKLNKTLLKAKEQLSTLKRLKEQQEFEKEADEIQAELDRRANNSNNQPEIVFSCEKTSKKGKFVAGLFRMTKNYEQLKDDCYKYSAEELYEYLFSSDLPTDEELKELLNLLEMPYKMYRRINDYLKKQ